MADYHEEFRMPLQRVDPRGRLDLIPYSYATRAKNREPDGWMASAFLAEGSTEFQYWPDINRRYTTERLANSEAMWSLLRWLEAGRPPIKTVNG